MKLWELNQIKLNLLDLFKIILLLFIIFISVSVHSSLKLLHCELSFSFGSFEKCADWAEKFGTTASLKVGMWEQSEDNI